MKRPTGVSVIAIYKIVTAALGLLSISLLFLIMILFKQLDSQSYPAEFAMLTETYLVFSIVYSLVYSILSLIAGIVLLKLQNWARILCIVLSSLSLISVATTWIFFTPPVDNLLTFGLSIFSGIVTISISTLIIWYLSRSDVKKHFS